MTVEVLRAGALTTIQDEGRAGFAHLGVPHSGAADREALRTANALAGNDAGAAVLETTLTGPSLRFQADALIALAGALSPAKLDGAPVALGRPISVQAGSVLELGTAARGLRSYIAVQGGIDAEPVLASRSTDTLTGIGPRPLRAGDVLRVGQLGGTSAGPQPPARELPRQPVLRISRGPREDLFVAAALETLTTQRYQVTPESSRVGVRFAGPALERIDEGELLSEGLVRGALQVPPSGMPIAMLADHPTTGGYPVIAVVAEADHGMLGQLRPGQAVSFALEGDDAEVGDR